METKHFVDPFLAILPELDLHGETKDVVRYLVLDFINAERKMGNYKVSIIHGRHGGTIKSETHDILSKCDLVEKYYIYGMNDGVTIVEIKRDKID